MKKLTTIVLIVLSVCLVFGLCACSKQTIEDKLEFIQSVSNAKKVTKTVVMTDAGMEVYSSVRIAVIGDTVTVQSTVKQLGDGMKMEESVNNTTSTKEAETTKPLNLSIDNIAIYEMDDTTLDATILQQNVATVLGIEGFEPAGDMSAVCTFENKNLVKVECRFTTTGNRSVVVTYVYEY